MLEYWNVGKRKTSKKCLGFVILPSIISHYSGHTLPKFHHSNIPFFQFVPLALLNPARPTRPAATRNNVDGSGTPDPDEPRSATSHAPEVDVARVRSATSTERIWWDCREVRHIAQGNRDLIRHRSPRMRQGLHRILRSQQHRWAYRLYHKEWNSVLPPCRPQTMRESESEWHTAKLN